VSNEMTAALKERGSLEIKSALVRFASLCPAGVADEAERCRFDFDARSHGRGNRDALDVGALGAGRFCLGHRIEQRLDVFHQLSLP
jgi:hypothetical protein